MEHFAILRPCMYVTQSYEAGQIITDHITGEHLVALGFAVHAAEDAPTDATESDTPTSRQPAAAHKE